MVTHGPLDDAPYRLLVCDLRTDRLLERLPVQGLAFTDYIGKSGRISGTVPIPDTATARRVRNTLIPARTALYVERGNEIWWGGVLWTRSVDSDDRGFMRVQFQGATFDSYFEHRLLFDDLNFPETDQFAIVHGLLDYAQSAQGGNIGIVYDPAQRSGIVRDRFYKAHDLPTIRHLIDLLSQNIDPLEWRIRAYRTPAGQRVRELQLGYPQILGNAPEVLFSKPGNVLGYAYPEDGSERANRITSQGNTAEDENQVAESVPVIGTVMQYPGAVEAGWPLLDDSRTYSSVTRVETLDRHTEENLPRLWLQHTIPEVDVVLDGSVTPAMLGTRCRVRVHDQWFDPAVSQRYRVVGMSVKPPERGMPETARLYLEDEQETV